MQTVITFFAKAMYKQVVKHIVITLKCLFQNAAEHSSFWANLLLCLPCPWFHFLNIVLQTVLAGVMGATLYVLARKISQPVREFLDGRSQVSKWGLLSLKICLSSFILPQWKQLLFTITVIFLCGTNFFFNVNNFYWWNRASLICLMKAVTLKLGN